MIDLKNSNRNLDLEEMKRRTLKYYVPELKDRDDYEIRDVYLDCEVCGKKNSAVTTQYRLLGSDIWKNASSEKRMCWDCWKQEQNKEFQKELELDNERRKKEMADRLTKEYFFIPEDLKDAGFKNYEHVNNVAARAKQAAVQYYKDFIADKRYNLLLMGSPGTGKTHLCTAIARSLKQEGILVGFLTTGTLLRKIKTTYQKGASKTEEEIINDIKKFELLVLDDLGSEASTKDEFAWSKKTLFEIVNSRIGKPTIYTTNFNEEALPNAVGEHVFSRLNNNTKFVDMFTDDYRKNFRIK